MSEQWRGLPVTTQGQQSPHQSVHRYDLLAVQVSGLPQNRKFYYNDIGTSGPEYIFPSHCLIQYVARQAGNRVRRMERPKVRVDLDDGTSYEGWMPVSLPRPGKLTIIDSTIINGRCFVSIVRWFPPAITQKCPPDAGKWIHEFTDAFNTGNLDGFIDDFSWDCGCEAENGPQAMSDEQDAWIILFTKVGGKPEVANESNVTFYELAEWSGAMGEDEKSPTVTAFFTLYLAIPTGTGDPTYTAATVGDTREWVKTAVRSCRAIGDDIRFGEEDGYTRYTNDMFLAALSPSPDGTTLEVPQAPLVFSTNVVVGEEGDDKAIDLTSSQEFVLASMCHLAQSTGSWDATAATWGGEYVDDGMGGEVFVGEAINPDFLVESNMNETGSATIIAGQVTEIGPFAGPLLSGTGTNTILDAVDAGNDDPQFPWSGLTWAYIVRLVLDEDGLKAFVHVYTYLQTVT